jgi:polar amino acid transport system substrate-binding protein
MKLSLLLVLGTLCFSVTTHARSFDAIKKDGNLLVATEGQFPPFNFIKDHKIQGFEIDLVDEMAKRLGLKTTWSAIKFDDLLIGLYEDHYDLVAASHAQTAARANAVDFLPPHYCSGGQIVSLTGGPKTLKGLQDKKVGAQQGSIYPHFLEKAAAAKEVVSYSTDPDVMKALMKHDIDAAITDRFMVKQIMKTHPELQVGDVVNPEKDSMAVKKGNKELGLKLKGALQEIMKDGTYEKISRKYFDADIRCKKG